MGKIKVERYSDVMTPEEVSQFLRCSQNKVYKMLEDGEIPGLKIAGGWRILKSNLMDMFKVNEVTEEKQKTASMPEQKSSGKIAIGAYAKDKLTRLILSGKLPEKVINNLMSYDYCKQEFKANFAILKQIDKKHDIAAQRKDANGYSRYYKDALDEKYLLSSQWYEHQRRSFDRWYSQFSNL